MHNKYLPIRAAFCVIAGALSPRRKRSAINIMMFTEKANVTPAASMVIIPHIITLLRPNLQQKTLVKVNENIPFVINNHYMKVGSFDKRFCCLKG